MSQSILEKVQTSKIYFCPASENAVASYHLIYFITGNPGLISYYNTFLGTLHELLGTKFDGSSHQFHIYGQSLAGFEDNDTPAATAPYSLEDQINFSFRSLQSQAIPSGQRKDQPYDSVILIGHSVGSYILLEILQRLRNSASPPNVKAGILLFPTVTHIAQSPSGVKMSTLLRIPDFPRKASLVAKSLVWLAPRAALKWLVGLVTRMPHDAAEVTTAFLKSRMGVWQALHMAKDEMETITEDKWDEDIWGIEHEDPDRKTEIPRLIFYFGENDHWVADHTRDALIVARAPEKGQPSTSKPVMLIDQNGVDHGFCIRHSESIAEKVHLWTTDILEGSAWLVW